MIELVLVMDIADILLKWR